MGNSCCRMEPAGSAGAAKPTRLHRPVWASEDPLTEERLQRMRNEFWDTEPHYGGDKVIWDALRAACEADEDTALLIIETAGIIIASDDMRIYYDERGAKYELPKYVLSEPTNLIRSQSTTKTSSHADEAAHADQTLQPTVPTVTLETMVR